MWPFHTHKWIIRTCRLMVKGIIRYDTGKRHTTGEATRVLYLCERCGDSRVELLDGHWKLEELTV